MNKALSILLLLLFTTSLWSENTKIDSLQNELRVTKEDSLKIKLMLKISTIFGEDNLDSNLLYKKKALLLSEKKGVTSKTEIIANIIAKEYYDAFLSTEKLIFCKQYYKKFKLKNLEYGITAMTFHIAHSYQALAKEDSSSFYFSLGINNANINEPRQRVLKIKMLRSRAYFYSGSSKYTQAITDLEEALFLLDSSNYSVIASVRFVIASFYTTLGDRGRALTELGLANEAAKKGDNYMMKANAMYFYASFYLENDNEKAEEYALKGLEIYEQNKHSYGILFMKNILSEVYLAMGNLDKAEVVLKYIEKNAPKFEYVANLAAAQSNLGEIAVIRKNYLKALNYCNFAWRFYKDYEDYVTKADVCKCLSEAHEGLNHDKQALLYYKKAVEFNDSLNNEEQIKKAYRIQNKYDLEKKETLHKAKQQEQELIATQKIKTKNQFIIGISIFSLLILGLGFSIFKSRQRKREVEIAIQKEKAQELFSQQLLESQENEKIRISRELHDSVGQDLILLKNNAQLKNDKELEERISATLNNVREITQGLHPFVLEQFGLTVALQKLVNSIDNSTDIFITEEIENIDGLLSKQQELGVYRITQEAINNIIKHAESPSAVITTKKAANFIELTIKDYGKGFDWSEKSGAKDSLGMKTLQERAKILNANFNIDSALEKGTTIYLKIPLKNA